MVTVGTGRDGNDGRGGVYNGRKEVEKRYSIASRLPTVAIPIAFFHCGGSTRDLIAALFLFR